MDTLNYMFVGYLVIWALAFGFVFNLWARSRRVERDLVQVRQLIDDLVEEEG